ncbi:MAG: 4Fe-4S dicluster domain-containing protein [Alphaproteobacteria bacterium]|nr:MAG: 4Fe-4S dicluster domain-containing protein [Alphaproteobacteria bacterium]
MNIAKRGFGRLESFLDKAFGPDLNPLCQLGAYGYFCYWIVAASGIYLYIAFDTSITGVYESMEYLTHDQWYLGGLLRSFHRYASDAMVFFLFLHLFRELAYGRLTGPRAFSWMTGVPLILFLYAAGITGYWLVWDELAQYIAIKSAEWLDWLPIFSEPIARNFVSPDRVDDRFFSLMIFIHIFVPLFLLLLMWIHVQRITKPKVNLPRMAAFGFLGMLTALSLISPATSHAAADLSKVPADLHLDWYYLALYPLLDYLPAGVVWFMAAGFTIALLGLPALWTKPERQIATVHLDNCNGCEWCLKDCPYSAISMVPRTDGKPYRQQAAVNPNLCVGCGICAGSCPTGSPYRRGERLVPGIELEGYTLLELRDRLTSVCTGSGDTPKRLVVRCSHASKTNTEDDPAIVELEVPCVAMFSPAFLDYTLAQGLADEVVLAACGDGECFNRTGLQWTRERFARQRDPRLRGRVNDEKWRIVNAGSSGDPGIALTTEMSKQPDEEAVTE